MTVPARRRDDGTVLPLVLVITLVLGAVVLAVANYSTASLKFGHVAEDRSDRLAAADAGMRYAIDQIKLRNGCIFDDSVHVLPGVSTDFNGATASVDCRLVGTGLAAGQLFAAVVTGVGVPTDEYLVSTQGGGGSDIEPKVLGGPVFLSRVSGSAMDLGAKLEIERGMLYYPDASAPCTSISQETAIANGDGNLRFEPAIIYGPWCVDQSWDEWFYSPWVPDLTLLPELDGTVDIATDAAIGSYTDVPGDGGCRVFEPGRYITPPDVAGVDAYFTSGEYVFDFPNSDSMFEIDGGVVTFGHPHPLVATTNEQPTSVQCVTQQDADRATGSEPGATIYLANSSHIEVRNHGTLEIHARKQQDFYVSVQALCSPAPNTWCRSVSDGAPAGWHGGDGNLGNGHASTLSTSTSSDKILFTKEGNNKEFIAHGYFYAPLAKAEFGNATSSAEQKLLGGIVIGKVHLQASASATNFEIAVPTSPMTGRVEVTSTAVKNGTTRIKAILEFRYDQEDPDDRVRVNSWRVCQAEC